MTHVRYGVKPEDLACAGPSCFPFVRSILEGLSPTLAASAPDDRSLVERFDAWKRTGVGRLALYGIIVGAVAGLYYGAGRAGLHLAYLHGTVTALWPPVGVGVAALVVLGPRVWPGIVIGDLLLADFSTPWGRSSVRRSGTRSKSSSRRCCSAD